MKFLVFGTGKYYQNRKKRMASCVDIIAFIDNNPLLQGTYIENVPVISPNDIKKFSYDAILLMSVYANEMKRQLINLGIKNEKIWYWEQFVSEIECENFKYYCGSDEEIIGKKKILIISDSLNYNGGSFAAIYAFQILFERGYNVILAAPYGDSKFIQEMVHIGVNIVICPVLPYLYSEEKKWIRQFDVVLVNVFQMVACACEISKIKPVMWWIHVPKGVYADILYRFDNYAKQEFFSDINIYAVSEIPKRNFNYYFPDRIKKTLSYGIPDKNMDKDYIKKEKSFVFAVIGYVMLLKAQDIFVQAAKMLEENVSVDVQFWLIGFIGTDEYSERVRDLISDDPQFKILGMLTRDEMEKIYEDIDVVVCPSLEDSLPIVMTEAMMYEKVCITSDATGTADYIEDGKNGFICKAGNPAGLSGKMQWIINNRDRLQKIRFQARKTYEEYFTLESFGDKLEKALLETIDQYKVIKKI